MAFEEQPKREDSIFGGMSRMGQFIAMVRRVPLNTLQEYSTENEHKKILGIGATWEIQQQENQNV